MKKFNKLLLSAGVLTCIYFISLHAFSGTLGGILFLLTGWAIPSIVNLLITLYLVSKLSGFFQKIISFILISFLLGINTHLPYLFLNNKPTLVDINVLKPLQRPEENVFISRSGQRVTFPNNIYMSHDWEIKSSPFSIPTVSGDEGCACLYFKNPETLAFLTYKDFSALLKPIATSNILTSISDEKNKGDYHIKHKVELLQSNYILLTLLITDSNGGKVIIRTQYPHHLYLSPSNLKSVEKVSRQNSLVGFAFFRNTMILFLHNNFWQWIIDYYAPLQTFFLVKTPFDILSTKQKEQLFQK